MGAIRAQLMGQNRALALWIIACALLLRIIVPAGWMPSADIDGRMRITLCTSTGLVEAYVDRDGTIHEKSSKSEPKTDQPCSFAGMGVAIAMPTILYAAMPPLLAAAPILPRLRSVSIGRGLAAPPPPAIGPPAIL